MFLPDRLRYVLYKDVYKMPCLTTPYCLKVVALNKLIFLVTFSTRFLSYFSMDAKWLSNDIIPFAISWHNSNFALLGFLEFCSEWYNTVEMFQISADDGAH
jgi:hypothetical protein